MEFNTEGNTQFASVSKPWLKYYAEENLSIPFPQCTMYQMLKSGCSRMEKENDTAIHYFKTKITYSEMLRQVEEYAAAFRAYGVEDGDCVSFLTVSIPESIFSIYALNKIGALCNFIDVRTDEAHIREYILKAKSQVLIVCDRFLDKVAGSLDALGLRLVICQDPSAFLPTAKKLLYRLKKNRVCSQFADPRVVANKVFAEKGKGRMVPDTAYIPEKPAVIIRTGGTTGTSKGVVLTNDCMNAITHNFRVSCMNKVPRKRSLLNFLPIGSSYGIAVGIHMAFCLGCENILIPNFNPDRFDRLILRFRPNHIIAVPVFYQKLIDSKRLRNKDLSFVQTMAAGGDSANEALEDRLEQFRIAHGIAYPVSQGYGLSEASSAIAFGFQNIHKKGSAGIPSLSCVISIFSPGTTQELPIGEIGEICVSGATVMKEYLDEPEETANVIKRHPDGKRWIHTGDLGYLDEDGFIYIIGRIKRTVIRFDGHKVYPLQLEQLVMKHPQVSNCAVIAVPDQAHEQGMLPLVIAQLADPNANKTQVRAEILALCKNGIEMRSQPADVTFIDKMPLTDIAKVNYRQLEQIFSAYRYRS